MKAYSVLIIASIMAAGLAGCASESRYSAQFFKASGPDQPVRVLSIFQTSTSPSAK